MAVFLSSSTCRGYLVPRKKNGYPGDACDFFGSKAIFVGEEPSMKPMLQNFLHINASPTPRLELQHALPMSDEMIQAHAKPAPPLPHDKLANGGSIGLLRVELVR